MVSEGRIRMKSKVIAIIGVVILAIALIFAMKPKSFDKQFEKKMSDMNSYILKGDMEIIKGEDIKTYAVEVGYRKAENDLFKVTLLDKELNQEQIIIKNDAGVFVVTPSLNQIFKFEGDWPMNSPKPYLLQTIADIVIKDDAKITEEKEGYRITSKVNYPNNKNFNHEEIMFDKEANVKWLQIFNKDNTAELKIVFNKTEYNVKIEDKYFEAPSEIKQTSSVSMIGNEDLPLYPVMVHDSRLENVNTVSNNGQTKHILEYAGNKAFTVVETVKESAKETQTVIMPGEIIDVLDVVGFYDGNHISAMYGNVEFSVFSEELGPEEMMQVIMSMQVAVMK